MAFPELPTDGNAPLTVTGHARSVRGRLLVVLPYAAPIGPSRGRFFRIETDHGKAVSLVVFSLAGQAALRPPDSTPLANGQPVTLRLRALPPRRSRRVPGDLERALTAAGLTLEQLDGPAAQHLLLMVTEARAPAIRAQRVRAAVEAARHASSTTS